MKWANVTDSELVGVLNVLTYHHAPLAARNLIEYFHERLSNEMPYNEDVLHAFVKMAFQRMVEKGWSADHAFGLELKRGHHQRKDTLERDVMAAAFVVLRMRQGWRWEEAIGGAANLLMPDGAGEKAMQAAYKKFGKEFSAFPSEVLQSLLPTGTPVISRDMTG